jgi:hypothetical protein
MIYSGRCGTFKSLCDSRKPIGEWNGSELAKIL